MDFVNLYVNFHFFGLPFPKLSVFGFLVEIEVDLDFQEKTETVFLDFIYLDSVLGILLSVFGVDTCN